MTQSSGRKLRSDFRIWVDASAISDGHKKTRAGAGWILQDCRRNMIWGNFLQMPAPQSGSSVVAEFNAAAESLLQVPADSCVQIYSDCQAVMNYLRTGKKPSMNSSSGRTHTYLEEALEKLDCATSEKELTFPDTLTSVDKIHAREAHLLARMAAKMKMPVTPSATATPET